MDISVVIAGLIGSLFCSLSVGLSDFLIAVDDGECDGCADCMNCFAKREIQWRGTNYLNEWMLVSFLKVKRKCQYCHFCSVKKKVLCSIISFVCFLIPVWSAGGMEGLIYGITSMALFFLSVVDWNTQYIPLEMNIVIFICGLVHLYVDLSNWLDYVIGLIAVSGFLLLVNFIATPVLKKRYEGELTAGIGDGDLKLMAATGLLLGWKLNFIALGIGCVAGSIIHLILMKVKGSGRQFALGPYLSLGVYITMICGEQLISWYLNVMGVTPY